MFKIAFFDVDGTLLKMGEKDPSKKTVAALKQLQEQGVLLCMATGRSYPMVPTFEEINFDILLTFNGSYVANKEQVIFDKPINHNDKNTIIQNLKNMKRPVAISNEYVMVANGTDEDLDQYFAFGGEKVNISEEFNNVADGDVYQIMCSCVKEEYETILQGTKNAKITSWWDKAADIIPADSGKGNAVDAVLAHYGIAREESIAFGDGGNDIDMLKAVGNGVAMGNAKDNVKEIADVITHSVEDEGIYRYCLENNLIHSRI